MNDRERKHRARWLMIVTLCGAALVTTGQSVDDKIKCSISMEKQEFRVEAPVVIRLTILNEDDNPIVLQSVMRPQNNWVKFFIKNEDGREVKFSGPITKLKGTQDSIVLYPGYFYGKSFDLTDFFDLEDGRYSIYCIYGSASSEEDRWGGKIKSNTISFVIK